MSLKASEVRDPGTYSSKENVRMTTVFNVNPSDNRAIKLGLTPEKIRREGITESELQRRMNEGKKRRG